MIALTHHFPVQIVGYVSKQKRFVVTLSAEVQERIGRLLAEGRCLACEEVIPLNQRKQVRCGQCKTCYPATRRKINDGLTTVEKVAAKGEMLMPLPGGRKPKNKYTQRLSELK